MEKLAPNPEGFRALVEKLIALEHEPMAWEEEVKALDTPILIIAGTPMSRRSSTMWRCFAFWAAVRWATWASRSLRHGWRSCRP